jgi:hypothetical protein
MAAIMVSNSSNNIIDNNDVFNGIDSGSGSNSNVITSNTLSGNTGVGSQIVVESASQHNFISGNSATTLTDQNANCDDNVWLDNTFSTGSASCIH